MSKAITIELPAESEDLRRKLGELSRDTRPGNPYRGRSLSEIAQQLFIEALQGALVADDSAVGEAMAALASALEEAPAAPIAAGSYTRETLPPLGTRAQALLDSIWDDADAAARPTAAPAKRRAGSGKPRGRLKLTDHGGESVAEYLARR